MGCSLRGSCRGRAAVPAVRAGRLLSGCGAVAVGVRLCREGLKRRAWPRTPSTTMPSAYAVCPLTKVRRTFHLKVRSSMGVQPHLVKYRPESTCQLAVGSTSTRSA